MGKLKDNLINFSDECIDCGVCLNVCSLLEDSGLTPGQIARQVVDGQLSDDVLATIQRCMLCGLCSQECFLNLNPSVMFKTARELLMKKGIISPQEYDVMLVDRDWNYFSIYRDTFQIHFDDLKTQKYDTMFFPGCTLVSYAPELTRQVFHWLQENVFKLGFTEMCCGKPLESIGLQERQDAMLSAFELQMQAAGAKRLITACPNCFHNLQGHFKDIEIVLIYDLMNEAGIQIIRDDLITFHDSCPDRYTLQAGNAIRNILSGSHLTEMEHHGEHTICCGSGGIVSMVDPELCACRAEERIQEFRDTGADYLITGCMACSHRLARAADPGKVIHCLELFFDSPVDYSQIQANIQAMWEGEWGEHNLYRLSQAKIVTGVGEQTLE